jgi:hypothetical protein
MFRLFPDNPLRGQRDLMYICYPVLRYVWIFIAMCVVSAPPVCSADVAVVIDVSGTMAHYGPWQSEALALVKAVLSGESIENSRFTSTGLPQAASHFKLSPGESIHVLQFGSIQTAGFPFFLPPQKTADGQLGSIFPMQVKDFSQGRTNKELAIAVAARLVGDSPARMIVISDFLVDADASQQQQQFINEFQAKASVQTPLIFNWLTDNRVMIRMMVASWSPQPTQMPNQGPPEHQVQILEARQLDGSPIQVQVHWRLVPPGTAKSYRVNLRDARTRKVVRDQGGLVLPSATVPVPGPGDYILMVTAEFENGSQAVSRSFPFKVEGSGNVLMVVFVGIALGLLAWQVVRRINQHKAAERRAEKEED